MRGNGLSVTPPVPILTLVCPTVHPSCPFHSTLGILIPHPSRPNHTHAFAVCALYTFPPYYFTEDPSSQTTTAPSFACVPTSVDQI